MRRKGLPHTKTVRSNGRSYVYFDTGQVTPAGKPVYARLPDPSSPQFGATYAGYLSAKSRRAHLRPEINVTEMITLYERSPKFSALADGSQRLYGIYLKQFREEYPTAPAGKLERKDILRIIDKRAKTPGAANSLLRTIAALYKWARQRGHVANDPTKDIEPLEVGEHEPWPEALVTAALASDDDRVRLATHLLLYTAQRIDDVCKLRWSDIHGDVIRVRQQKTKRLLDIRIHDDLAAELAKHPRSLGTIIPGPLHQHTLRTSLQVFAAARGFKVVPHGLRKNAVNALLEAGCSAAETAAISGQTLGMVEHYAKSRSQSRLGSAAILKWNNRGTGKR